MSLVELSRPSNLIGTAKHFIPVSNPARRSSGGEDYREQASGDANRLQDNAGVEIYIRV